MFCIDTSFNVFSNEISSETWFIKIAISVYVYKFSIVKFVVLPTLFFASALLNRVISSIENIDFLFLLAKSKIWFSYCIFCINLGKCAEIVVHAKIINIIVKIKIKDNLTLKVLINFFIFFVFICLIFSVV